MLQFLEIGHTMYVRVSLYNMLWPTGLKKCYSFYKLDTPCTQVCDTIYCVVTPWP